MHIRTDILIIGSGIAGLTLALKLAEQYEVTLVTKKEAMEGSTRYAQGGIAAVLSEVDQFESHIQDTLTAGAGLCNQAIVEKVVREAPHLIEELSNWGVPFSLGKNRRYDLGREGGHSERRVVHAGDMTGAELSKTLYNQAKRHPRIEIKEFHTAIDLILKNKIDSTSTNNRCLGAYVFDEKTSEIHLLEAKATVLATGGTGKVYLYTTNPDIATGDGVAMAYRAGLKIANMEFIQFHPTTLYNPSAGAETERTFLISEAVRGEGAILKRRDGTPFMQDYHTQADLAPRDIVARAIDKEMKRTGEPCVYLDLSHKKKGIVKKRFPNIYLACKKAGYDMEKEAIPVVPATHYSCGGIKAELNGTTSLDGLYAIGECAHTGLHGANRLASNSLLEALVMADSAAADLQKKLPHIPSIEIKIPEWDAGEAAASDEAVMITQNWDEIRRLMWNYVGIVRSNKRLMRAKKRITLLQEEIKEYYWNFKLTRDLIELRNLAFVAELIIDSAIHRHESRGLHYNLDYPETVESERVDTILTKK